MDALGLQPATSDQLCPFSIAGGVWGAVLAIAIMVEFPSEPSADPGSNLGIFEGVDESTDRCDAGVKIELSIATAELDPRK